MPPIEIQQACEYPIYDFFSPRQQWAMAQIGLGRQGRPVSTV